MMFSLRAGPFKEYITEAWRFDCSKLRREVGNGSSGVDSPGQQSGGSS